MCQKGVDRVRSVYERYDAQPKFAARWNRDDPGNSIMLREREDAVKLLLRLQGYEPRLLRIMDLGCGTGEWIRMFLSWGLDPKSLVGIELMPERAREAKRQYPDVEIVCGDAAEANFPVGSFDLVVTATVFSSIKDRAAATAVARRAWCLVRGGGGILWYDIRTWNPVNLNVRRIGRAEICELFPEAKVNLRSITLCPPLARLVCKWSESLYLILSRITILRTHYLGLLLKDP